MRESGSGFAALCAVLGGAAGVGRVLWCEQRINGQFVLSSQMLWFKVLQ
jgi:hypothetical protein